MTDKNTADKHAIDNNVAQGIAAYIDYLNQLHVSTLMDTLRQILNNEDDEKILKYADITPVSYTHLRAHET